VYFPFIRGEWKNFHEHFRQVQRLGRHPLSALINSSSEFFNRTWPFARTPRIHTSKNIALHNNDWEYLSDCGQVIAYGNWQISRLCEIVSGRKSNPSYDDGRESVGEDVMEGVDLTALGGCVTGKAEDSSEIFA
jgi:hypothetical protein